ncbi:MAG: hypothetical protein AB7P14_03350 [Blastocatellales bacterium]
MCSNFADQIDSFAQTTATFLMMFDHMPSSALSQNRGVFSRKLPQPFQLVELAHYLTDSYG